MAALVAALLSLTPLARPLSRTAHDVQLRLLASSRPSADVVVFDIDDISLAELKAHFGPWPFKRDVYALVVEQLRDLSARAIAIDLLLADSGEGDAALARTLARPGAPVVLAAAGLRHATDLPRAAAAAASVAAPPLASPGPSTGPSPGPSPAISRGTSPGVAHAASITAALPAYLWPTLALPTRSVWPEGRAPPLGVITTPLDDDGVLRALPLWHHDAAQQRLPVMPWAVHLAVQGAAAATPPLDADGAYHLAMPASEAWPAARRFAELAQTALGQRDAAALRPWVQGRAVFIGSSALLADAVMTPQGQVSGTMALAQATAALGEGSWVRPRAAALDIALVLLALLPGAAAVWRGRPAPPRDAAAALLALAAMVVGALWALFQWRQPSDWVTPLATLAAGWSAALFVHHRGQAAARRRLAHQLAVSEEATRAKSAFLANVSHEIRTPLNALLGVAELLAQSELTPRQRLHVQVFRESGQALHSLINDLLDLSRIEAGRLELHPAPFDLHHALTQLVALMRARAEDKGLSLVLDVAEALPRGVLGDRLRLEQALINLVGNAVKFTSRGEVRLAALPDPQLPGMLRFDVIDTGIGIAPGKLETIFEPFAQADGSVTRLYGGTGLGLSITRSIVRLMGGSVQVQSVPGAGSTFTLRLPLPAAALPAAEPAPAPSAGHIVLPAAATSPGLTSTSTRSPLPLPSPALAPAGMPATTHEIAVQGNAAEGAPLSVLLAEDNQINVYLFRSMLEGQPLALEFASDGHQALERLRQRRYDIAFIDVQMPGLDGLTVTRELRALEAGNARRRTPVVALTANAFASDVRASLDAGCDRHLAKPYSRTQLIEAIQQLAAPLAPPPPAAPSAAESVLDRMGAIERLGGDPALYQRLAEHAAGFMTDWAAQLEHARRAGSRERAFRLAHDLKSVASSVGALAVAEHAGALEQSLRGAQAGADGIDGIDEGALQRTLATLPPVIAALAALQTPPS
ncbi:MAG: CHASE2 domain-containing protein [Burkholderiales bacterium]|nr:CHASE2 domain-containing protein [Burkholderiales bacterium]